MPKEFATKGFEEKTLCRFVEGNRGAAPMALRDHGGIPTQPSRAGLTFGGRPSGPQRGDSIEIGVLTEAFENFQEGSAELQIPPRRTGTGRLPRISCRGLRLRSTALVIFYRGETTAICIYSTVCMPIKFRYSATRAAQCGQISQGAGDLPRISRLPRTISPRREVRATSAFRALYQSLTLVGP
jgi:hypothetical protein